MPDAVAQSLEYLVERNVQRLTDADTRLLSVLMEDPLRAAMADAKSVSSKAGVHPASAVRLARRLGFRGYPHLREYLRDSLLDGGDYASPAARVAARLVQAEARSLWAATIDSEITALQQARSRVLDGDIRAFSRQVRDSRRVILFGRGHAATLSAFIALRLRRSGYEAVDLAAQLQQAPEYLASLGRGDVLWFLVFRKPCRLAQQLMVLAREKAITTLLLSDKLSAPLNPAPDCTIAIWRGAIGQSQSLVLPMTVANAIILDLAAIDDGRSLRALDALSSLTERFDGSI